MLSLSQVEELRSAEVLAVAQAEAQTAALEFARSEGASARAQVLLTITLQHNI